MDPSAVEPPALDCIPELDLERLSETRPPANQDEKTATLARVRQRGVSSRGPPLAFFPGSWQVVIVVGGYRG